ncbi:GNAT family N-acetyltransferase [Legionella hackeliae]|uniref:Protein elaA n=1 Tax=Legionella hackeliae TaxID=449 RepID=A0A0A8UQ20_LEGHA|nr:GNAT family N-acetyltransferase [Legionella hackeliae]KTD10102.1 GNAT family acetyltransferase [Legionella hackeliae]CEK09591.1 Protein elaA [Legionella hackeliae]STX49502.1 acyltransferase [Legionella hackeliae]
MTNIRVCSFDELSKEALYEILALRSDVFIVEQQCFYQDLDFKDQDAQHLLMYDQGKLIAYARILAYGDEGMSFGRLVTAASHRGLGLGKQLMDCILSYLKTHHSTQPVIITAQNYLRHFYGTYGFIAEGEPFDMDGLPHVRMVKSP